MDKQQLIEELNFKAVRSGGPGGQHANKVSSKVVLSFHLSESPSLTDAEKLRLTQFLKNRLSQEGVLTLHCDESRSQHQNRALLLVRFLKLLETGLKKPKPRKQTAPPKKPILKRLDAKKKQGIKKQPRRKPGLD